MERDQVHSHLAAFKQRLSTFLTRSGSHPLRIQLVLGAAGEEYADDQKVLISLLWPHSGRWQSFDLSEHGRARSDWLQVWTDSKALRPMPHLKALFLRLTPYITDDSTQQETISEFYILFANCPSLTTLFLHKFPGTELSPAQTHQLLHGIPWQTLRELNLYLHTLPLSIHIHLHDIFSRPQNLTHLRLRATRIHIPEVLVGQFVFPKLEGLVFDLPGSDWILFQLVTPRLEALELNVGALRTAEIAAFIARSQYSDHVQCLQITRLNIAHDGLDDPELGCTAQILSQKPKLRLLSVKQGSLDQCIEILRYLEGSPASLPLPCLDLEAFNFCVGGEGHGPHGNGDTRYLLLLDLIAGVLEARVGLGCGHGEDQESGPS